MCSENDDVNFRVKGARDKESSDVIVYDLDQCMQHFNENIKAVKALSVTADDYVNSDRIDEAKTIWRSQIALSESDFDYYMHELTKYGLNEIYEEDWSYTSGYDNLKVRMKYVKMARESDDNTWLLQFENEYYEHVTMMSYDSVITQLNILGIDVADVARRAYGSGKNSVVKKRLSKKIEELKTRRNTIVHQADRKVSNAAENDISKEMADKYISDIENIVNAIDYVARNKPRLK